MGEARKYSGLELVGLVIAMPAVLWFDGYALALLWRWFVVPLGMPSIGVAHALGLGCVASVLRYNPGKPTVERDVHQTLLMLAYSWLFALGYGYLLHVIGGL